MLTFGMHAHVIINRPGYANGEHGTITARWSSDVPYPYYIQLDKHNDFALQLGEATIPRGEELFNIAICAASELTLESLPE